MTPTNVYDFLTILANAGLPIFAFGQLPPPLSLAR